MKLYYTNPQGFGTALVRVTAKMTAQELEYVPIEKDSEAYKKLEFPDKLPMLETTEGNLYECTAIAKYLCSLAGKLLGSNAVERSQVDQWVSYVNSTMGPGIETVCNGIFGWQQVKKGAWDDAAKNLKTQCKVLNTALEGKKFLVGNELSFADLVVVSVLMQPLQTVLDSGFRKAMKNVEPWATSVFAVKEFVDIHGKTVMCAKPLKPVVQAEAKEEKPKKVAAAPAPKKEEKPKANTDLLPATPFNLYDFKTLYCNHKDQPGAAVDKFYEMLDWEGWAFQYMKYDIMDYEKTDKEHKLNNFVDGFINRAQAAMKLTFGKLAVMGEEGSWEVWGVWLMRGKTEVPDALTKDHSQFEYFNVRLMDPRNNKEDDALVRAYFSAKSYQDAPIEGKKVNKVFWQK